MPISMNDFSAPNANAEDRVAQRQRLRKRLETLANTLDTALRIPGTKVRFGADAIVGLIPGLGDVLGLAMGLWLIWQARGVRAPFKLQVRMLGNLALEAIIGAVPILGDAFDVLWQANQRNRQILTDWMDEQDAQKVRTEGSKVWLYILMIAGSALLGLLALSL